MALNVRFSARSLPGTPKRRYSSPLSLGNPAYIAGVVKVEGIPVRRRVRCYTRFDGRLVGEVWSDESGNYRFDYLELGQRYLIVSLDYNLEYNAVVADNVLPVAGLPPTPQVIESALLAPTDFSYVYDSGTSTNTVSWKSVSANQDEVRIYRSTSPMDPNNLPTALATLSPYDVQYEDTSVSEDTVYYYRISAVRDGVEVVSEEVETIPLGSEIVYQYWRLYVTNTPHGDYLQVAELELADPNDKDLTDPSGASASDYASSSYTPDNAMDDSANSRWYTTSGLPQWLMFSADSEIGVASYTITAYTADYAPGDFELQGSTDGENWVTLDVQTGVVFSFQEKKTFSLV